MICLYNKNESDFTYNGLGTLEPIECLFSCVINDVWKVEMTLPYDPEGKYKKIDNDMLLKITDIDTIAEQTSSYQLFRIYDYRKEDTGLFVAAYPIGLDARHDTYGTVTSSGKTAAQAIAQINGVTNKYTVSTDIEDTEKHTASWSKTNIIAMLNGDESFTSTWGGEIAYDNYNIKVNMALGRASGVGAPEVRYGKNIRGMSVEYDTSNVITRLYPIANSGEALNAISEYKIGDTQYIDSDNASDYPIPHISTVTAPYNLIQLSDDGSDTYRSSIEIYGAIKDATAIWLHSALTGVDTGNYGALLSDIELGWLADNYAYTMEKDGTQGVVEYLYNKVINATGYVIRSSSFKNLVFNAMKEAFDDVLKNDGSGVYIGTSKKKLTAAPGISPTKYFYSYEWDTVGDYRVKPFSDDYMWVYANSKWNQLDSNGLTTGTTDSKTWKWYKVSGKTWKRYGNKSKKRYLKDYQHWEISNVWYQFGSDGHGISGADYFNAMIGFIENFEVSNNTLISKLAPLCKGYEQNLFQALYGHMDEYATVLFMTDGLSYPVPNISIDVVDLSKTTEYIGMEGLLRFKLGDTVKCVNSKLGIETNLRVTGIVYDCIRKCNNQLTIGMTDNDLVNMFMKIGEVTDIEEYTAGDGIVINGKTISALPQGGVTDIIVGGQSVVYGGKGYIDIDEISGEGLQWFEETEDALYGVVDDYEMSLVNDPIYRTVQAGCNTENGAWSFSITGMDTDVITVFIPKNYVIIPYAQMAIAEPGGIFIMTNDVTKFSSFGITAVDHWASDENEFGSITWNEGSTEGTTIDFLQEDGEPGIANFKMARSAVSVDGEMWYCVYFFSGYDKLESIMPSISTYLSASQIPVHGDVPGFESLAEVISTLVPLTRIIPASDHNYNGLSREGDLAFFAGANDEHGNGARIKIYRDGTYDGFDMVGATSSANGKKGVVPQPLIADREKFLRGDGTWANPSGSGGTGTQAIAYKYLTPTAYGNLSSAEKSNGMLYLISDNGDGSTGFFTNYRVISPTDYENLTTAEKENGTLYLVTSNSNNAMGINVVVEDEADYTSASDNLLYLLKEE